jgi:hypothetical protein
MVDDLCWWMQIHVDDYYHGTVIDDCYHHPNQAGIVKRYKPFHSTLQYPVVLVAIQTTSFDWYDPEMMP